LSKMIENKPSEDLHNRTAFRLGKACQAVSVKQGVSERVSIVVTDDICALAIVKHVGTDWKYGDLVPGQLEFQSNLVHQPKPLYLLVN
jgi:hypothetical protein